MVNRGGGSVKQNASHVIQNVSPVILNVSPVIENVSPVILNVSPVILNVSPVIENVSPVIENVSPVILNVSHVILNVSPVILNVSPVILNVSHVILNVRPVILNVRPVILNVSPVILNECEGSSNHRTRSLNKASTPVTAKTGTNISIRTMSKKMNRLTTKIIILFSLSCLFGQLFADTKPPIIKLRYTRTYRYQLAKAMGNLLKPELEKLGYKVSLAVKTTRSIVHDIVQSQPACEISPRAESVIDYLRDGEKSWLSLGYAGFLPKNNRAGITILKSRYDEFKPYVKNSVIDGFDMIMKNIFVTTIPWGNSKFLDDQVGKKEYSKLKVNVFPQAQYQMIKMLEHKRDMDFIYGPIDKLKLSEAQLKEIDFDSIIYIPGPQEDSEDDSENPETWKNGKGYTVALSCALRKDFKIFAKDLNDIILKLRGEPGFIENISEGDPDAEKYKKYHYLHKKGFFDFGHKDWNYEARVKRFGIK